ncbi:hypothetical protein FV230_22880 [Methylobacterium sp. WL6]|nr:hypothetical protein FV230_22880 [Methylobacterium sp. WL6]
MTHARILALDTAAADPIHAAIQRHRAAYDANQVAPEGKTSVIASDDYDAATDALMTTPCASWFGALALLGHLRWWLSEEAEFSAAHQPGYGIAQARVADLTLFSVPTCRRSRSRPPSPRAACRPLRPACCRASIATASTPRLPRRTKPYPAKTRPGRP